METHRFIFSLLLVLLSSLAIGVAQAQQNATSTWRRVGSTPLSTQASTFSNSNRQHGQPITGFWGNINRRPYATNEFWGNLIINQGTSPIKTFPYLMRTTNTGLSICYPGRTATATYIVETFLDNLVMTAAEGFNSRALTEASKLHATVRFGSSNGGSMTVPFVRGMAYVTGQISNLTPKFTSIHAITSINGMNPGGGGTVSGQKFKVAMNNGQNWLIYTSSSITFRGTGGSTFQATGPFTGSVRVALLQDSQTEQLYDTYADAIPIRGSFSFQVLDKTAVRDANGNELFDKARITFNWEKTGNQNRPLLMFALPHHADSLVNPQWASPQLFMRTIKGYVTGIIGDTWVMEEQLTNLGFYARNTIPDGERQNLINALNNDRNQQPAAQDPYFFGKQAAKLGRLALIADQLNLPDIAAGIRNNMKNAMRPWLDGSGSDALVYEQTYGGICAKNSLNDPSADFGMGWYNDHHFHFGYHVYAAAVIGRQDQNWLQTYGTKIMELIRDYANPVADSYFPQLRNKDPFVGHSFAAGLYEFADIKNQESTSEAINAYYAITLFARVVNNRELYDLGRILLATEIRSTEKYWHIKSDNNIYDDIFKRNKCVGISWETKVDYATFFGANVEFIHGIQMMPYTPATELYLPRDWIQEEYPVLATGLTRGNIAEGWKGFIYMTHAIIDKAAARREIDTLRDYDDGNTRTNTLYWVVTRPGSDITSSIIEDWSQSSTVPPGTVPSQPEPQPQPPAPQPSTPGGSTPSQPSQPSQPSTPSQPSCTQCNDAVIGTVCYDPNNYVCANNRRLCPKGASECNLACFDATNYKCCNGQIKQINDPSCGGGTTPSTPSTPTTPTTPPSGCTACEDAVIGRVCYDPNNYICANNRRLCPKGTSECNLACFDSTNYKCCNGQIKPMSDACQGSSTTPPSQGSGQTAPAPACTQCKDAIIGTVCYDPNNYVCANNRRLCPKGNSECNLACYDTNNYKCCNGKIKQKSESC